MSIKTLNWNWSLHFFFEELNWKETVFSPGSLFSSAVEFSFRHTWTHSHGEAVNCLVIFVCEFENIGLKQLRVSAVQEQQQLECNVAQPPLHAVMATCLCQVKKHTHCFISLAFFPWSLWIFFFLTPIILVTWILDKVTRLSHMVQ